MKSNNSNHYHMKKTNNSLRFSAVILTVFLVSLSVFSFQKPADVSVLNKSEKKIETLTTENFNSFVNEDIALVDFWAAWCYPCRLQNPILEDVNSLMGDKVKMGKLNVDENKAISTTYGITSIPTLIIFKKGKVVERLSGLQQKDALIATLNKHIE